VGVLEIIVVLDVRLLLGAALQSAKMEPVATERLVKEVRLAIAAQGTAGVVARQIIAVQGVKWLLEAVEG
jgi:hypothetical protein